MKHPHGYLRLACALLVACAFVACPSAGSAAPDDLDDDGVAVDAEIWDPFEGINRAVFGFNDTLDVYVLEPVARGYDRVAPRPVQDGVRNFFDNLRYPTYLVSDVVQLKFGQALEHTGRFLVNSTVGVLGVFDVAEGLGLERHREDFGVALAYHGVPPGPYIVLPFFGPSNLRDGFGFLVDTVLDPLWFWPLFDDASAAVPVSTVLGAVRVVDTRASLLEAVTAAKESSLDYYSFVQSSYYQYRRGLRDDAAASSARTTGTFSAEAERAGPGDGGDGTSDRDGGPTGDEDVFDTTPAGPRDGTTGPGARSLPEEAGAL